MSQGAAEAAAFVSGVLLAPLAASRSLARTRHSLTARAHRYKLSCLVLLRTLRVIAQLVIANESK